MHELAICANYVCIQLHFNNTGGERQAKVGGSIAG